ncbi:MAG: VCBS repeat-containing protein [Deltaproteobacteria bacterium]|nr:VCBS repeat-containing protein [Deltaproteobacteria bacterium]
MNKVPTNLAVADFNNDGCPDFAVLERPGCQAQIEVFVQGAGNLTFTGMATLGFTNCSSEIGIVAADFDKNNKIDIITHVTNPPMDQVLFFKGNGDGTFQTASQPASGDYHGSVHVSDTDCAISGPRHLLGARTDAPQRPAAENRAAYWVKAAYTLFRRPGATPDTLQASHREAVRAELQQAGRYLLLEDTTEMSWSGQQPIVGLGPIGSGDRRAQGFLLHSVLAVRWTPR